MTPEIEALFDLRMIPEGTYPCKIVDIEYRGETKSNRGYFVNVKLKPEEYPVQTSAVVGYMSAIYMILASKPYFIGKTVDVCYRHVKLYSVKPVLVEAIINWKSLRE